jgi:serine/threonine protein kinase
VRPEIRSILNAHEMAGERLVNHIRLGFSVAYLASMAIVWPINTLPANLCFTATMVLWVLFSVSYHRVLRACRGRYVPALKYVSIAVDTALVASMAVATHYNHSGLLEFVRHGPIFFMLFNVLAGLRYRLRACVYAAALSTGFQALILGVAVFGGFVEVHAQSVVGMNAVNLGDEALILTLIAATALVAGTTAHSYRKIVVRVGALGTYDLVERIGRGGVGEVWRASHRMLKRPAAIKLVNPEVLADGASGRSADMIARFEREAQVTAELRSVHTVELYDYGVVEGGAYYYYVMELLEGLDLRNLVLLHGPLPPARVVFLLRQACRSLAEAHRHGLVHRDIKPANLFVCRLGLDEDFVKVLDFGIVKPVRSFDIRDISGEIAVDAPDGTVHGNLCCTPAFMAPEMVLEPELVGPTTDIYQLGCVAYWLLTGELVFPGDAPLGLMHAHMYEQPPPVRGRSHEPIPDELASLVSDCLRKEPEERPSSAEALADRLAAIPLAVPWGPEQARRWWDESGRRSATLDPAVRATDAGRATFADRSITLNPARR